MVDGEEIILSGETYTIPPIPLSGLAKIGAGLSAISAQITEESVTPLVDAVYHSLRRNYPEITRAVVDNGIDLKNVEAVLLAFQKVNGFDAVKEEAEGE